MMKNSVLYPITNRYRMALSLDGMWQFQFDPKSCGLAENWKNGLPSPISMPVPASFSDFFTNGPDRDYCGDFWYQKDFFVPETAQGKIQLRFGSITHRAIVFCNGIEVARHEGGFLPVVADVTDVVRRGAVNRVCIWVNNDLNESTLPCGTHNILSSGRKIVKPYFDFFNYSGIQRSVYLVMLPAESIQDYEVSYTLDGADAQVNYKVFGEGAGEISVQLLDAENKLVAEATGAEGTLCVQNAHLWQVRNAYLYTIVLTLKKDGVPVDEYRERIGIRTVEIRGTKILINGKPVYLKGFGKHEDFDILGRGFNWAVAKRDFECMKWTDANCFRTSHYPYAEEWYQMADEEGFLIIDEVPAVGMMRSTHNFAAAGTGQYTYFFETPTVPELLKNHIQQVKEMMARDKNHPSVFAWSLFNEPETTSEYAKDYFTKVFEAPTVPELLKNHIQQVKEMMARDKNHPSVFAWSLFNEPETTSEYAKDYFTKVFEAARTLDPQNRPLTGAFEKNSAPDKCRCYQLCDFICLNRYYGWYISGGAEMEEAEVKFRAEMDKWAAKKLNVPFVFTEFGTDTLATEHKLPAIMWSQEYQNEYLAMNFSVFDSYDFVQGELVWNFADFQTSEGVMRVNGNKKGIFTRQRQPKDAAFTFKKRWESLPLNYKSE